jgi:hypothetical protein
MIERRNLEFKPLHIIMGMQWNTSNGIDIGVSTPDGKSCPISGLPHDVLDPFIRGPEGIGYERDIFPQHIFQV